jgi:hypothetical protein
MREDLGDGYAETLRAVYPEVPESADFVLYWWHKAAGLVRAGQARRFGLITTNSLRQTFARRVVQFAPWRVGVEVTRIPNINCAPKEAMSEPPHVVSYEVRTNAPLPRLSPSPIIRGWTRRKARRCALP